VPKATIKLARWKVLQWGEPKVDVWSDELYWVHRKSGAVRWTKPTTQEYVPANFVMPAEYRYVSIWRDTMLTCVLWAISIA